MTSRELVRRTLSMKGPERIPRQLWTLKWADIHHREELRAIQRDYPADIAGPPVVLREKSSVESGDPNMPGEYTDAWGCTFTNIHPGVIGEVKKPQIRSDEWDDAKNIRLPEEWLTFDEARVNQFCAGTDKFVACGACPRPFEQLQFLRGSENFYADIMDPPKKMLEFMEKMHDFYCRLLTRWAQTDVDSIDFMDDWGAQRALLISPQKWDELFGPMYRDYIEIARRYNKKTFMHSDGYTLDIIPRLIDMGLDAFNTQIFCIGVEKLAPYKGHITFWGEIDRQWLLPYGTLADIDNAVDQVYDTLYDNGGVIAQCEFGAGAKPENVRRVFERWDTK